MRRVLFALLCAVSCLAVMAQPESKIPQEMLHSPAQDSVLARPLTYPAYIVKSRFVPEHVDVLSINNSLIYVNKQDSIFNAIAAKQGKDAKWTMHTLLGRTLLRHWEEGDSVNAKGEYTAKYKVRTHPWTHIVLQEQSRLPRANYEWFRASVHNWVDYIRRNCPNPDVQIFLTMNWGYNNAFDGGKYAEQNDILYRNCLALAQECGITLVPVGLGNQDHYERGGAELAGKLHNDECHPSFRGTYMASCMEYAVIFNESPVEIKFDSPKLTPQDCKEVRECVKRVLDKFNQ